MNLLVPISDHDLDLARPLARWMQRLGPYLDHRIILCFAPELLPETRDALRAEFSACGWAGVHTMITQPRGNERDWPGGPNGMFRCAAGAIESDSRFSGPWWFFEPDCTPVSAGWLDTLDALWKEDESRPFLGCIDDTWEVFRNPGGQIIERATIGQHMVGTGIYPSNLSAYSQAHHDPGELPFDHALRHDIIRYTRHTTLIQHNWNTQNYRREGSEIVCDQSRNRVLNFAGDPVTNPVRPNALVIHGCKDSSLIRVLSGQDGARRHAPKPATPIPAVPEPTQATVPENSFIGLPIEEAILKSIAMIDSKQGAWNRQIAIHLKAHGYAPELTMIRLSHAITHKAADMVKDGRLTQDFRSRSGHDRRCYMLPNLVSK